MKWVFILKQDSVIVARGEGEDKDFILREACHYFSMYAEEDFKKINMEIKEKGSSEDDLG